MSKTSQRAFAAKMARARKKAAASKDLTGAVVEHPDGSRTVFLSPQGQGHMKDHLATFKEKFGREPRPEDPIFWDPDSDTPQPMSAEKSAREWTSMIHEVCDRAREIGMNPVIIYAMRTTRLLLLTDIAWDSASKADQDRWFAAEDAWNAATKADQDRWLAAMDDYVLGGKEQ